MTQGNSQYLLSREENAAIVLNFVETMLDSDRVEFEYFIWALSEVAFLQGFFKTGYHLDEAVKSYFSEK